MTHVAGLFWMHASACNNGTVHCCYLFTSLLYELLGCWPHGRPYRTLNVPVDTFVLFCFRCPHVSCEKSWLGTAYALKVDEQCKQLPFELIHSVHITVQLQFSQEKLSNLAHILRKTARSTPHRRCRETVAIRERRPQVNVSFLAYRHMRRTGHVWGEC